MNKKILTTGAAFAAIALTTLTFAGVRNNLPDTTDFTAMKTAIETNNYASLPDAAKAKITEAQFATMVAKNTARTAEESAIIAGDYTAFRNAKIAEIPTETEFKDMVAIRAAQATAQAAIETAIKNNDFAAFQKAHTDLQTAMTTLKFDKPGFEPKTPDATQMKKRFDKMVAQYKADGTLPKGPGKEGIMGRGMGGMMGETGDHMGKDGNRGKGNKE